jgi:hypothetical protein
LNDQNGFNNSEEYVYKKVMLDKKNSRAWSVASLSVSVISLLCCCFVDWLGLVLSALSIVFALISRKNIGYFDGLAIAGLIIGIAGMVFGVGGFLLSYVVEGSEWYSQLTWQIENPGTSGGGALPPDVT